MTTMLTAIVLASAMAAPAQDPMMGVPPKELKSLFFMVGDFDCDFQMWEPGGTTPMPMKGTISTMESLSGMYLESRHEGDMGGMVMKGLQMTSYDAAKKQYMAYWFDSMGPGALEMWGTLNGQTLTLVSKPVEIPGMPGKARFRATSSMKGVGKVLFRLEMDMGQGWGKMIEGMMTKK